MPTNAPHTQPSILKNVLIVTPLSLIGRAGTLLIYALLATWFGDTVEMDFIYYYWGIAAFLIELLSAASAYSVLVPLLAEARSKSETDAQRCVQAILPCYITLMPGLCCLFVAISWAISLQFDVARLKSTPTDEISIVCWFLCFAIIASVRWMLKAILDTYQAFQLPVIVQGVRALLIIATIYLCKPYLTLFSIPLALIFGELFQVVILFRRCCAVLNLSERQMFKGNRDYKSLLQGPSYTKQFLRQCFLMMGAAVSDGLNPVVDRGMASTLGAPSVSKLDYALRLCAIPETLTGVTLPILLSHWADFASGKRADTEIGPYSKGYDNAKQLQQSVWRGVITVLILMGPFLLGFYFFRMDIVTLLYGHGKLSEVGQSHIASLLGIYLLGMLPRLISRLLIRAHLARQNHLPVVTATLIRLVLNPFLNWTFMQYWGLEGIAWSTALLSFPIFGYIAIAFWRGR